MDATKERTAGTGSMKRATKNEAAAFAQSPDPKLLAAEILQVLKYRVGKDATVATQYDWLTASIKVVRDRIVDHWMKATKEAYEQQEKRVYYLSLEFLIGRLMRDAFSNVGLMDAMREALA
jgi:starch phosphorylase